MGMQGRLKKPSPRLTGMLDRQRPGQACALQIQRRMHQRIFDTIFFMMKLLMLRELHHQCRQTEMVAAVRRLANRDIRTTRQGRSPPAHNRHND
ncbi:hypothetical protein D3C85_1320920 [compost metagenome]